ncbi:hydrogenase expression/formation protein HypE [Desulfarculus baarsii DSM 2075]|uniref:Hydrogenase expression/formation protein HypE n=1 Tax=Desulfarculus baarsii (strain ATCC 33931 / DSM 2075 / LMG 7858 / VKM B-1802 / 2st14) TaxID=644282 RepID=E1QKK0_DESB2|nr:hydrogenase expression/formation protein HypE [Desulfarculus baarsii]ADK86093.1 hydrogenase expression/formation protein HypE [Desulfarculus baarsii DSM 2075]
MAQNETIQLDHGAGGLASRRLLERVFAKHLANDVLAQMDDAAVLAAPGGRLVVSTDSFVVDPLFFPGGDIGCLAVHGTVNDVAMRGGRPLYLTAGFVLEEGLALADLERVVASMGRAAAQAGVKVIAGDTKVVGRGQADKLFINTAGIGVLADGLELGASRARAGDAVLVSGTLGDHGVTIMAARQGLGLDLSTRSDTAPLADLVADVLAACPGARLFRDPTRGGLATALKEIAEASGVAMELDEAAIPIAGAVAGACELLGLDPLYLANEGKLICVAPAEQAQAALAAMRGHRLGDRAAIIGRAVAEKPGRVWLNTAVGGRRLLEMLSGEPLPRIC